MLWRRIRAEGVIDGTGNTDDLTCGRLAVATLIPQYRGRLAFHGGLSTQRTLPFGTCDRTRAESRALISLGRDGGYIFSPAHAVEGDVPLENMLAFIEEAMGQPGFTAR